MVLPRGPSRPIALVGMMGAGKTTVGRLLAARLGRPFRDLDEEIEQEAGRSVAFLFEREGEPAFREREHRALARLLDGQLVLATGGGAVLDPRNRGLLKSRAYTIWVDAAPETLARRLAGSSNRPLLQGSEPEQVLRELLATRRPFYAQADACIHTDGLGEEEVSDRLFAAIGA